MGGGGIEIPNVPHWASFPFMEALIEYAHALGRAHTGDLDGARKAIARMQQLRDATKEAKFDYFKRHLELQTQAASAWIAYAEGKKDEAIEMLRRAADSEDILGKHPVSPGALVPIREQLGTLLLKRGRRQKRQKRFKPPSKFIPVDSEDCTARRWPPSKSATKRMRAAITRSWPPKHQKLAVHEMN